MHILCLILFYLLYYIILFYIIVYCSCSIFAVPTYVSSSHYRSILTLSSFFPLSLNNISSIIQFSMAHAQLELNVNCSPTIALKILSTARTSYPSAAGDVRYVCMLCRVLTLLGDLKQIRWIFQTIIGEAVTITPPVPLVAGAVNLVTSGLTEITSGFGDKGNARGPKPTTPGSGT